VLPLLLAHTADRFLPRTRAAAATALGQLAAEVEAVRLAAADRLSELAVESPFRVRLAALSALGRARHAPAAAVLRRVHTSDPDGRVARTAYEALQSLSGGDAEVAKLRDQVEKLVDQNRSLRERIDKLEGRLGDA
jgi:HEAT repeat protein